MFCGRDCDELPPMSDGIRGSVSYSALAVTIIQSHSIAGGSRSLLVDRKQFHDGFVLNGDL